MLAIVMKSEYQYDIDLLKVIFMLAIHELGETVIGDLTQFQVSKSEKEQMEHEAVHKILKGLLDCNQIESLFLEFDAHATKEAIFAYQCDKLECDLQSKLYNEEGCVDLNNERKNELMANEFVSKLFNTYSTWSEAWMRFGQQVYPYDENFRAVSNFAIENDISETKITK